MAKAINSKRSPLQSSSVGRLPFHVLLWRVYDIARPTTGSNDKEGERRISFQLSQFHGDCSGGGACKLLTLLGLFFTASVAVHSFAAIML